MIGTIEKFENLDDPRIGKKGPDGAIERRPQVDMSGAEFSWPLTLERIQKGSPYFVAWPNGPVSEQTRAEFRAAIGDLGKVTPPATPNDSESVAEAPAPEPEVLPGPAPEVGGFFANEEPASKSLRRAK